MFQRKNILVDNLNIQYFQSENINKKKTLLFLHGWGSRSEHFRTTLEKCGNFLAVDLPGFGGSEMPEKPWALVDFAAFVQEFLKKLDIESIILAGHSFGGSIGIKYCSRACNCKKLILIGSSGIRKIDAKKICLLLVAKIFRLLFLLPGLRSLEGSVRGYFYKLINSEDYIHAGALVGSYKKIIGEDLTNDLKKINVTTILIWGENDEDVPLKSGKLMNKLIKNSQLFVVPDAKHYVFIDNRKKFEEIFLSQIK